MRHIFAPTMIALISAGWIVPLYWGTSSVLRYFHTESTRELHSFPFLLFAEQMFLTAAIWGFIVGAFWAFVAARRLLAKTPVHSTPMDTE